VRDIWKAADLAVKQSLIGLLLEKVVVLPGRPGSRKWRDDATGREWPRFDFRKIELHWRA
jgi:hypothetical protein